MNESCRRCGAPAVHMHHRKRRSQGGDNSDANLIPVCATCHDWIHHNVRDAYGDGWLVYSWADPAEVGYYELAHQGHPDRDTAPEPGTPCATCGRRVPHPKKKTSPKSRTVSLRIPDDGIEEWDDLLVLIAERVGVSTKEPYFKYKALLYAMREALA